MRTHARLLVARVVVSAAMLLTSSSAAAGPKTDIVHLGNGDRITCEIKKLDRAKLTLSTDPLETVTVHWGEVADLISPRVFEIEVASGAIYYGSLAAAPAGQVTVRQSDGSTRLLRLQEVIRITPIGSSAWARMDGNIDLGFSFAQADLETRWTLNSTATYRSPRYRLRGSLASQLTAREDAERLSRHTLTLSGNRLIGDRWFTIGMAQLQQNEELSLDLRALAGGGFGRQLSQTNTRMISGFGGLVVTRERFAGEASETSLEGVIGANVDFFSPRDSDFEFTNAVVSYYNLSSRGRVRLELQSAIRREFLKDFYWSVNGFESFDSTPPEEQKQNDAGITIALGWKF